jgi:hypothetical protein
VKKRDRIIIQQEDLKKFIMESFNNRNAPHKWVRIGLIENDAQKRIKEKCGIKISEIHIDNYSVIHALKKKNHNLQLDDLLYITDVINTTTDISLSDKKHKSNDVLIFKKDIFGEITFLAEVHIKNDYLLIFNAWRQKKARRGATA